MGSERKSKEKSRKRASGSHSEDEGEPKRRKRSSDDYAEGSSKRDKKEKSRHSKSHKRDSKTEKKSEKKHKSKHPKHDRHSKSKFTELSIDDYFAKNNEFATWLKEEKKKFFSDLSSDSARELFSEFVEAWNSKKLESKYYKGIQTGPRSSHNWKIKD